MVKSNKIACVGKECVACGCCTKTCPKDAIHVPHGVIAVVDSEKCIGCGKCAKACPAAVIEVVQRANAENSSTGAASAEAQTSETEAAI